jgi:hypothetical protein
MDSSRRWRVMRAWIPNQLNHEVAPADGTNAAHFNDGDFGASREQLAKI